MIWNIILIVSGAIIAIGLFMVPLIKGFIAGYTGKDYKISYNENKKEISGGWRGGGWNGSLWNGGRWNGGRWNGEL